VFKALLARRVFKEPPELLVLKEGRAHKEPKALKEPSALKALKEPQVFKDQLVLRDLLGQLVRLVYKEHKGVNLRLLGICLLTHLIGQRVQAALPVITRMGKRLKTKELMQQTLGGIPLLFGKLDR
jgi:hypothetical protein